MSGSPRLSRKPAPHTDNREFAVREVQVADSLSPYMAVIAEYSRGQMKTDGMARKISRGLRKLLAGPRPVRRLFPAVFRPMTKVPRRRRLGLSTPATHASA